MNAATPGSESKFVMTNVLDTDPVSGLWHQIAVYPPRLLVEFGIKFILGHIYTAVVRMNTDGSKQVVPYNSAAPGHGTQFPSVCSKDHWLYHFTY